METEDQWPPSWVENQWKDQVWGIEPDAATTELSAAEKECDLHFQKNTKYRNEKFTVGLPWINNERPVMPNNYYQAKKSYLSWEEILRKRGPAAEREYFEKMQKYVKLGCVRRVSDEEVNSDVQGTAWYLPHFPVFKKSDKTASLRVVFNGKVKCQGHKLNDKMHSGKKLQADLAALIMRFRRYPFFVIGDIRSMFLMLELAKKDQSYCRYLWRSKGPREGSLEIWVFTSVLFGLKASPYLALACLWFLAEKYQLELPLAAEALADFYVDDFLRSCLREEGMISTTHEVIKMMQKGNFQLAKFRSNSSALLRSLPADICQQNSGMPIATGEEAYYDMDHEESDFVYKVLGVVFYQELDCFIFDLGVITKAWLGSKWTKREMLSKLASIYDPCGLICPYLNELKHLHQQTWLPDENGVVRGWKDFPVGSILKKWELAVKNLSQLPTAVYIPRRLGLEHMEDPGSRLELLCMTDASNSLLGMVVYTRVVLKNGTCVTGLLGGKSKVKAIKCTHTIPRLELMACELGVRYVNSCLKHLCLPAEWNDRIKIKFYTDSSIVFWWLHEKGKKLRTFVQNRLNYIKANSELENWSHVRSEDNCADAASRVRFFNKANFMEEWALGKKWIRENREPQQAKLELSSEEKNLESITYQKECQIASISSFKLSKNPPKSTPENCFEKGESYPLLLKPILFSKSTRTKEKEWSHLVRVLAYVRRFIALKTSFFRRKSLEENQETLLAGEGTFAERTLIRLLQQTTLCAEWEAITQQKPTLPKKTPLRFLNPFLCDDLLRVGSRLLSRSWDSKNEEEQKAEIGKNDTFAPLLLPHNYLTTLLILQTHVACHHGQVERTLSLLNTKYYLLSPRRAIKKAIRWCKECFRRSRKPLCPQIAKLPEVRYTYSGLWNIAVCMDAIGPFETSYGFTVYKEKRKDGTMVEKTLKNRRSCYCLVFSDLTIRLVTLVPVLDLTTESIIKGVETFIGRRGTPNIVYSDSASSFITTQKHLFRLYNLCNWDAVKKAYSSPHERIAWQFGPPYAPWCQGTVESLNKSIKSGLNAMYGFDLQKRRKKYGSVPAIPLIEYLDFVQACLLVEQKINDRPLHVRGLQNVDVLRPLTPSCLAFGRQLAPLPDLTRKPTDDFQQNFKQRCALVKAFMSVWRNKYLSTLLPLQVWAEKSAGAVEGQVVLISDKSSAKAWRLGIVEKILSKNKKMPTTVQLRVVNSRDEVCREIASVRRLRCLEEQVEWKDEDRVDAAFEPLPHPESSEDEG